jgi:hypothetical protein
MINRKKYRIVAWTLVTVFFVFNVGIPIVLAACPMIQEEKPLACCAQEPQSRIPEIKLNADYSCCNTKIASERNTTEFLQGKDNSFFQYFITPLLQSIPTTNLEYIQHSFSFLYSPPHQVDLPILHSSLLI